MNRSGLVLRNVIVGALFAAAASIAASRPLLAQTEALRVERIEPTNWYSGLPAPMLLVRGTGLQHATFRLSDPALRVQRVVASGNGHWAQVFLSRSPAQPETIQLTVTDNNTSRSVPYTFAAPRSSGDGMAGFSARDVMYLIMTDRFADGDLSNDGPDARNAANSAEARAERARPRGWHGGDLRGVSNHLDYLQQLGVTAVWLTPVYVNDEAQAYHGYHATDYYGVDPHFGTLSDLQQLAKALHARGMKLVLDTVPNHVGPGHPWVKDEPAPNWFHGTAAHHLAGTTNFDALIDPHVPERDKLSTLEGWFVDSLPDMNTDDSAVALYLRQNAVWWIEQTGADGLRIDTFAYVNRGFWSDFDGELKELFPHVTEVGEVFNGNPEITSAFADGVTRAGADTKLYTPFDFPMYFAMLDVFAKGKPMSRLAATLAADALYPHPERLVPFLGNHDTPRFAELTTDPNNRKLAFAFLMTSRGMPQIYSGDEIAMPGGNDPDDRRDFPGGFAAAGSDAANAFTSQGRSPDQQAMYSWVAQLAALRRAQPALQCGAEQILSTGADQLAYARVADAGCTAQSGHAASERLLVVLQRGEFHPLTLDTQATALAGCKPGTPLLGAAHITAEGQQLVIAPQTSFVVVPCQ